MTHLSAVAALDEPTRRRLYDFVVSQPEPVSRDEAAAAEELPRTTAAFHLDRLVEAGLLSVVHERRSGRTGPGAGRPAKLYHRSDRQITVSLPERRYDLAGQLLAAALSEAENSGESPRAILDRRARTLGTDIGLAARSLHPEVSTEDSVVRTLAEQGFEPRVSGDHILLGNCPFHDLARQQPELVCGMNLCLLDGLLNGLGMRGLSPRLNPTRNHCCVRLEPTDGS
ncbi:helix-turn-helix transcriptional regulator [Stackebrandtia nassauensis]|uniref:Putative transcriptional regulator n=1 Tax=Stackebrandtia nassauensis (strain DSM 44728 / CIP 108903 / NRRL B-16338 / NBRC 102104 / LLR-40K-21) TaxID=446470 RepID=D3Q8D2_STANL|nr:helix-turn-helix domain-containing protein [Stackebrandtia nassauensis]ADD42506.1 putative transcriptional regulator [Stackebrandtia nassauensis DSM 44728]